jgi:hypothetical protein
MATRWAGTGSFDVIFLRWPISYAGMPDRFSFRPAAAHRPPPPACRHGDGCSSTSACHLVHPRIGDQATGQNEFMVGQGGDELFPGGHRIGPREREGEGMARPRERRAGPGAFGVGHQLAFLARQQQDRLQQPQGRMAGPGPHRGGAVGGAGAGAVKPCGPVEQADEVGAVAKVKAHGRPPRGWR